jgi:hypothetical protein
MLRFELAILGIMGCSENMSGQNQEPRLIKNNKIS